MASSYSSIIGNFCIRPTIVRRTSITENSTLSTNSANYVNSDVTVNLNLNGNLLYKITENGNVVLYEDNQFTRTENSVTFKSSYLSSLEVGEYRNIVFEFTDGDSQTLKITKVKPIPDCQISGVQAVRKNLSVAFEDDSTLASNFTYQWQNSNDGTTWSNISNATENTYTVTGNDFSKYLRVKISTKQNTIYTYPQSFYSDKTNTKVFIYGDINYNGIVDAADVTEAQFYLMGSSGYTEEQILALDVDGNGIIDINDVTTIQMYLAGYMDSFPAEI